MRALSVSIDRSALIHNYGVAKQRAGTASVFAVVKADAYGHGAIEVCKALSMADAFAVVFTDEAIALRDAGIRQPLLVLQGPSTSEQLDHYVNYDLWPSIHDETQLSRIKRSPQASLLPCWLKVDTGMGRLGFSPKQAEHELQSGEINWFGMLTHLASADDQSSTEVIAQAKRFALLQEKFPSVKSSIANSAGIMAWPDLQADWMRPGLMLYGSTPFADSSVQSPLPDQQCLKPVMRVSAPLISVKTLIKGASVGYAQQYHCPETMPVGFVGAGYGDGLPRVLDESATVLVQGKSCPIIGRVSMDSMAIDLRPLNVSSPHSLGQSLTQVMPGEEVIFWGPEHPVELLAAAAGTISYELLTHIRGNRLYI